MMAKKKNVMKFRENFKRKMQIEQAKHRGQVDVYGGLGKVGMDNNITGEDQEKQEEMAPGFSTSAMKYVTHLIQKDDEDSEDDECLLGDEEEVEEELKKIDEEVKSMASEDEEAKDADFDMPLYKKVPDTDEGYRQILEDRFGHKQFKEGQLEALKILLEKKQNALVVLATGGGKSLVYQYASMFQAGLILVITPLISLMTDQLNKLPEFIPGAAINS